MNGIAALRRFVVIGISFADRMQGRGDDLGRGVGKSASRKFKSLLRGAPRRQSNLDRMGAYRREIA
jgi:hypothetical protein